MGLNEKKRMWRMVLFPFILLQRKKEKKKGGLKEKKRIVKMKKWVLGNKLIDLSMGDRVFIKWEMNIVVFISWVMNIMK